MDALNPPSPSSSPVIDLADIEREITALNNEAARLAETRLDQAEALIRRALALAEQHFGDRHDTTATCVNNLADTLRLARRYEEAEPVARRALALYEMVHGPDAAPTTTAMSNLALVLRCRGDLAGAESLCRRALAILEKAHGPEDIRVSSVLNNLAQVLSHTGRAHEAEPLMRRNISIFEKAFGADHPNVAIALNNLAGLLEQTGRPAEAEPLSRRHVEIFQRAGQRQGQRHIYLDAAINNYGNLLEKLGLNNEAVRARIQEVLTGGGSGNGWGFAATGEGNHFDLDLRLGGEPIRLATDQPVPPSAGAEPDFDALARAAERPDAPMTDRNALFGAVFRLKEWLFIARGELPSITPYLASNASIAGGAAMVKAFTDAKRLQAFAKENGLCAPDGSVQMLSMPVAGILPTMQAYAEQGVTHIHFNADLGSHGFFGPLASLPGIRRHLENAHLIPPSQEGA